MAGKKGARKRNSAEIEEQIRILQRRLEKAKAKENMSRFSIEIRKRIKAIMDNHNVELTEAEVNVIVNPCETIEKLYYTEHKV